MIEDVLVIYSIIQVISVDPRFLKWIWIQNIDFTERMWIRIGNTDFTKRIRGFILDPDPDQNETDPQHCK